MTDAALPLTTQPMSGTDPALTARTRRLVDEQTTELAAASLRVPLDYYRSAEQLSRERELLHRTPLALVESARLRQLHDFVVRDVLGTSVLVTRNRDGAARALLNYCRHRGARAADGCGNARRFVCPYHAWNYDSDGTLVGLPGQAGFDDVDRADYGLVPLPCEERHGIVWVVLTKGLPIDVRGHLGPLDAELALWDIASHEWFDERLLEGNVNWKVATEAFAENYHFPYVHGGSIVGMNTIANTGTFDAFGPHHRLGFATPWITSLEPGAVPLDAMALIYWIYPHLTLAVTPVGVEVIDILPTADPSQSRLRHGWLARQPAQGDEAVLAGYADLYEQVHAAIRDEDFAILPSCTDGVHHGQHDHALIGRNEPGVQNVVRTVARATRYSLHAQTS